MCELSDLCEAHPHLEVSGDAIPMVKVPHLLMKRSTPHGLWAHHVDLSHDRWGRGGRKNEINRCLGVPVLVRRFGHIGLSVYQPDVWVPIEMVCHRLQRLWVMSIVGVCVG